jgi:hypothetical protein
MAGLELLGAAATLEALDDLRDFAQPAEYVVGTNVEYAVYVEFGTSKMAAQPYLRPAAKKVMNEEADALADLASSTEELVKGVALSIEREAKKKVPVDTGNLRGSITAQRVA